MSETGMSDKGHTSDQKCQCYKDLKYTKARLTDKPKRNKDQSRWLNCMLINKVYVFKHNLADNNFESELNEKKQW